MNESVWVHLACWNLAMPTWYQPVNKRTRLKTLTYNAEILCALSTPWIESEWTKPLVSGSCNCGQDQWTEENKKDRLVNESSFRFRRIFQVQLVLDESRIVKWSIKQSLPKDCDPQLNGERQQERRDRYVAGPLLCQTANAGVEEWHAEIDHLEKAPERERKREWKKIISLS